MACQAAEKHPSVTECLYMHNVAKKGPKSPILHLDFHSSPISQTIELFIPFLFFIGFGRQSYENVYLHFLKVLPVLSCLENGNRRKENPAT